MHKRSVICEQLNNLQTDHWRWGGFSKVNFVQSCSRSCTLSKMVAVAGREAGREAGRYHRMLFVSRPGRQHHATATSIENTPNSKRNQAKNPVWAVLHSQNGKTNWHVSGCPQIPTCSEHVKNTQESRLADLTCDTLALNSRKNNQDVKMFGKLSEHSCIPVSFHGVRKNLFPISGPSNKERERQSDVHSRPECYTAQSHPSVSFPDEG